MNQERASNALQRRALAFSILGLLLCIVLMALVEAGRYQKQGTYAAVELLARFESLGKEFSLDQAPVLVLFGVCAGLFAGMLGMGGGVLKVAALLLLFNLDILLARAVSLTTMFINMFTASRIHLASGAVMLEVVRPMLLPAVIAAALGMLLGDILPRVVLTHFFGFFTLFLALNTVAYIFVDPHETNFGSANFRRLNAEQRLLCSSIGTLHGFVCGLLGISGGVITTPMQQSLLGVPAHNTVANSVIVSSVCTFVASTSAVGWGVANGDFSWRDVIVGTSCIGVGGSIGSRLGAHLSGRVPTVILKLLFAAVCLSAGLTILLK